MVSLDSKLLLLLLVCVNIGQKWLNFLNLSQAKNGKPVFAGLTVHRNFDCFLEKYLVPSEVKVSNRENRIEPPLLDDHDAIFYFL